MKIKEIDNTDYMFTILQLKLSKKLTRFKNEKYLVLHHEHLIYGIARYVKITEPEIHLLDTKHLYSNTMSIFEIWIDEEVQDLGFEEEFKAKNMTEY